MIIQQKHYKKTAHRYSTLAAPSGGWIGVPYTLMTVKVGVLVQFIHIISELSLQMFRIDITWQLGHIHPCIRRKSVPKHPVHFPVSYKSGPSAWGKEKQSLIVKRFCVLRVAMRMN